MKTLPLKNKKQKPSPGYSLLAKPRLLVVEDCLENIRYLTSVLSKEDYKIDFAIDGATAVKALNKNNYDLIVLDINLPDCDGFEILYTTNNNKSFSVSKRKKFIVHSSLQDSKVQLLNLESYLMCGHLEKPAEPDLIKSVIRDALMAPAQVM